MLVARGIVQFWWSWGSSFLGTVLVLVMGDGAGGNFLGMVLVVLGGWSCASGGAGGCGCGSGGIGWSGVAGPAWWSWGSSVLLVLGVGCNGGGVVLGACGGGSSCHGWEGTLLLVVGGWLLGGSVVLGEGTLLLVLGMEVLVVVLGARGMVQFWWPWGSGAGHGGWCWWQFPGDGAGWSWMLLVHGEGSQPMSGLNPGPDMGSLCVFFAWGRLRS